MCIIQMIIDANTTSRKRRKMGSVFLTTAEKVNKLSACERKLILIQCELSIPATMYIDHALQKIELAKMSIRKDQEAWDRVHPKEEAQT